MSEAFEPGRAEADPDDDNPGRSAADRGGADARLDDHTPGPTSPGPGGEPLSGTPLDQVEAELDAVMAEVQLGTLEAVMAERDDYLDSLRRLQADFENYKKRVARQQLEQMERAAAGLIDKLLPVLDTAELALSHGAGDDVAQLRTVLLSTLEREGLERIAPEGEAFDPNVADAVAHEPGDGGGSMTVAEVLRAGYRWKGRVVRPAMVKVKG